jgi:exodeoxyribonuclease VII small subunit
MPAKRKNSASETSALSFEDAMAELENIVEAMEGEQLPLDELVARYEEGSALLKHCNSVLASAKKRIELITLADRTKSEPQHDEKPGGATANETEQPSDDQDDSNDIRLF